MHFHVSNIGIIRNTLDDRPGLARGLAHDYPEDATDDGAEYDGYDDDEYADDDYDDEYADEGYGALLWPSNGWRPAVAVLGAVVAIGAIATAVIINSGDSASTKATIGPPAPTTVTSAPRTTSPPSASQRPVPSTSQAPQLPPETVTTLTPPSAALTTPPLAVPPPAVVSPRATLNPSTIYYSVTGTKSLLDLVNVVYTDARGYPQTEFNVSLPWTKVVVLNPGVTTQSVVATSIVGHVNCAIVNAQGQVEVASANNSNLATCTK
ncbi:MmpS family transport accessory protein [Mycobacterium sp. Aquia_213]|uniref:MmpS family transport accessory protein n=1 Tax=Mycobacterium sp. Aquia_213 TaxID=2991728 RepID=UPI0022717876|nr:MmpS family transport accessory protein [Mycobacterium sp. Aquia_213]WAC90443.1 MmpS family transport accessory protein [Mycobacterium sp. Aquia_213]